MGGGCPSIREEDVLRPEATQSAVAVLQMVKQREKGRVIGMKAKTIYGDQRGVLLLLGASTSST